MIWLLVIFMAVSIFGAGIVVGVCLAPMLLAAEEEHHDAEVD